MSVRILILRYLNDHPDGVHADTSHELMRRLIDDATKQNLTSAGAMTLDSMVSEDLVVRARVLDDPNADPRMRARQKKTWLWMITPRGQKDLSDASRAHSQA